MKVVPKIRKQESETVVYFKVSQVEALEILNKLDTHTFSFNIDDKRKATNEQIKFFWGLLDEFIEFFFKGRELGKKERDEIKKALYDEYKVEQNVNIRLSRSNVTDVRLFLEWIIIKFAEDYNFISRSLELQNEFNYSYVYSTIIANKCAICGSVGSIERKGKKVICLCSEHKELTRKELNEYHLEPIKIKEEVLEYLGG